MNPNALANLFAVRLLNLRVVRVEHGYIDEASEADANAIFDGIMIEAYRRHGRDRDFDLKILAFLDEADRWVRREIPKDRLWYSPSLNERVSSAKRYWQSSKARP